MCKSPKKIGLVQNHFRPIKIEQGSRFFPKVDICTRKKQKKKTCEIELIIEFHIVI